jgi:hypothetical protein
VHVKFTIFISLCSVVCGEYRVGLEMVHGRMCEGIEGVKRVRCSGVMLDKII